MKWLTRLGRPVTDEAVRNLAPFMYGPRPAKGSPQAKAFANLVRRGKTPTPEAIAALVDAWERRDAFFAGLDDTAASFQAAAFVDSVVRDTGAGPLWSELGAAMGWPREFTTAAINRLTGNGWLQSTTETRSLRAGPRYRDEQQHAGEPPAV